MSTIQADPEDRPITIECVLTSNRHYIETLTVRQITAQPWLFELVIHSQLLKSRYPHLKRVKAQLFVERAALGLVASSIAQAMDASATKAVPHNPCGALSLH